MLPTVWLYRNDKFDMSWLEQALTSLEDNTLSSPVYILGNNWPDADREAAALTLIRALANNRSVSSLVLKDANFNTEKHQALTETFQENKFLEKVAIHNLSNENGHRYRVPSTLFQSPSIRSVHLQRCHLDLGACTALALTIREGTNLTHLSLDEVEFDPTGRTLVLAAICTARRLQSFVVKNMSWKADDDMRRFVMVLALNRSIESLFIERMTTPNLSRHIAYLVSRNRHLRTLSIRHNGIGVSDLRIICEEGFANNTSIEKIMLSRNPIGHEGAQIVANLLKASSTITHVCLALTELGQTGCRVIAKSLPECSHVKHINLDGNRVVECGDEFLEALNKSYSVVKIFDGLPKLLAKSTCPLAWKNIDVLLRGNQAKRRFFCHSDEHPDATVPFLLQSASKTPDVLFDFLQQLGRPLRTTDKSPMMPSS
eukprot:scaffold14939_cov215-Amphora_coffeaeformis.AAC.9